MSTLTIKLGTLYAACSLELGVVCYGQCRDEALNNLGDEIKNRRVEHQVIRLQPQTERVTKGNNDVQR